MGWEALLGRRARHLGILRGKRRGPKFLADRCFYRPPAIEAIFREKKEMSADKKKP